MVCKEGMTPAGGADGATMRRLLGKKDIGSRSEVFCGFCGVEGDSVRRGNRHDKQSEGDEGGVGGSGRQKQKGKIRYSRSSSNFYMLLKASP